MVDWVTPSFDANGNTVEEEKKQGNVVGHGNVVG